MFVVKLNTREGRRVVWAVLFAVMVATARVMAIDVYLPRRDKSAFYKWCETASNWDYITSFCWK